MDIVTYALAKKVAAGAVSGVKSMTVNGLNLVITTNNDQVLTMTFPSPAPTDIDINADNKIVFTMEDGSTITTTKAIPGVQVSTEEGNALVKKPDGSLYVAKGAVEISPAADNAIQLTEDGLYAHFSSSDTNFVNAVKDVVKDNIETDDIDFSDF